MSIDETIAHINERIARALKQSDRGPDTVKLVVVTKTVGLQKIIEAIEAGADIFGENRVQEAAGKIQAIKTQSLSSKSDKPLQWHLIGHLQSNKAKTAVGLFDMIHSVDSYGLADELDRQAAISGKIQKILVQVKLADETSKSGVDRSGLFKLLEHIGGLKNLELKGLMTIPPYSADPEDALPFFRSLRNAAAAAADRGFSVEELSMGMSNDFIVAIEEGATMVRIGSSIFGERKY